MEAYEALVYFIKVCNSQRMMRVIDNVRCPAVKYSKNDSSHALHPLTVDKVAGLEIRNHVIT